MIAPAQDAEALEAHTKAMQYEKMLREQKLNQEQATAAKAQAEQLEFQKQKMKLELENQKQISSLKENESASISGGASAMRIANEKGLSLSFPSSREPHKIGSDFRVNFLPKLTVPVNQPPQNVLT